MLEEFDYNISVKYCKNCGWSITEDFFEDLIRIEQNFSYCKQCGFKLVNEKFKFDTDKDEY